MSRITLVTLLALASSIGCSDPADLVRVSFTRLPCSSRSACEASLRQFAASHVEDGVIALDFRTAPEPALIVTHGNFGSPMRELHLSAARCTSTTACWDAVAAR